MGIFGEGLEDFKSKERDEKGGRKMENLKEKAKENI